ncbi:unnamed protein product [Dibothriocephalus latus]|uniref:Uncharacterized protein n=1 Tax=Dibothriocephalus latus TaxID=60516 RepID=A0A3P7NDG4_DIBLA|nr:unnamed protein product [Dibothriocephalus latus]
MGVTMKPLVRLLKIKLEGQKSVSILETLNQSIFDHTLACIESISGNTGRNHLRRIFLDLDEKYIRQVLQRDPENSATKLVRVYEKVALKLHYASIQRAKSSAHLDKLPELVKEQFYRQMNTASSYSLTGLDASDGASDEGAAGKATTAAAATDKAGRNGVLRSILRTKPPQQQPETDSNAGIDILSEVQHAKRVCFKPGTRRQSEFPEDFLKAIHSKASLIRRRATIRAELPLTREEEPQPKLSVLEEEKKGDNGGNDSPPSTRLSYRLGSTDSSSLSDAPEEEPAGQRRNTTGGI